MRMSIENLYSSSPLPMRELRDSSSKPHINPSVLVIVIILSVVFLCSGILHILARCLGRRRAREPPGILSGSSPSNSIRGQLQHLFSLHDSGVEQVFIDTLPVFLYGSIRGLKDSADCAVCLNEFQNEDKLRLLPKCKHAFHTECIDTWLLSNSTCPLCRRSLLPDTEPVITPCASAPEEPTQPTATHGSSFRGSFRASLRGSFRFLTSETVAPPAPLPPPVMEPETPPMTPGPTVLVPQPDGSERTLRVELGKVNVENGGNSSHVGTSSRMARSYSMGSYEYVVDFKPPTHRTTLSDGIPELSSANHTPGQEDMFWASRGLDTPHSLSRVREIMTPSPGWNLKQKQQQDDDGEEIKVVTRETSPKEIKVMTTSPNPNLNSEMVIGVSPTPEESEGYVERSLSLTLLRSLSQEVGSAARKDKVWEVSVDVSEPSVDSKSPSSRKSSPLNWLRGRGRRLVYSAASPSATEMQQQVKENST